MLIDTNSQKFYIYFITPPESVKKRLRQKQFLFHFGSYYKSQIPSMESYPIPTIFSCAWVSFRCESSANCSLYKEKLPIKVLNFHCLSLQFEKRAATNEKYSRFAQSLNSKKKTFDEVFFFRWYARTISRNLFENVQNITLFLELVWSDGQSMVRSEREKNGMAWNEAKSIFMSFENFLVYRRRLCLCIC